MAPSESPGAAKGSAPHKRWAWLTNYWVLLVALLYVIIAWTVQAWLFSAASAPSPQATAEATATTGDRLLIHYPQRIGPSLPTDRRPAIAIWLLEPQVPPVLSATAAVTTAVAPAAASLTATLTSTPTTVLLTPSPDAAAAARVYELRLEVPWANLVDAAGAPASGVWRVTPAPAQATPIMAYLDPAAVDGARALTLTARMEAGSAAALSLTPKIIVERGAWTVGWRRWLALATDPIGVAAALLAVIVGAAVTWNFQEEARRRQEEEARRRHQEAIHRQQEAKRRQEEEERRRQQEERERERLSDISRALSELQQYLQTNPLKALECYDSLLAQCKQGQFPWDDPGTADRLTSAWKENAPAWLQRYYDARKAYAPGAIDARKTEEVAQYHKALADAYMEGPRPIREQVVEDLQRWVVQVVQDLQKPEGERIHSDEECANILQQALGPWVAADIRMLTQRMGGLRTALKEKDWSDSLEVVIQVDNQASQKWTWPSPWPSPRPAEEKAVQELLGKLAPKLNFNPFGPELAEWDCELPKFARLDLIERVAGPRPVIVLGGAGAGKTATALLLARQETLRTFDADAFPVYPVTEYRLDLPMARADWLDAIESAFAAYHLRFLARNYQPFVASAGYRQAVLLLLLRRYGALDAVVAALRLEAGGAYNEAIVDLMSAEAPSVSSFPLTEPERIRLLRRAIPSPQQHAYVILDLEQSPSASHELLASNLNVLFDLVALLAQHQIYAKIIAPEGYPISSAWIERVELTWPPEKLKEILASRFQAAGPAEFAQFCDPREGDLTDRLIELSQGNPRRLVRIGNGLWRKLAAAGRYRVIAADLDEG